MYRCPRCLAATDIIMYDEYGEIDLCCHNGHYSTTVATGYEMFVAEHKCVACGSADKHRRYSIYGIQLTCLSCGQETEIDAYKP